VERRVGPALPEFDVLFDELHGVFDNAVWKLSKAMNPEEKMALERAGRDGKHESNLSFQNLHNIQKYFIHYDMSSDLLC
jgi:hypothetical protein